MEPHGETANLGLRRIKRAFVSVSDKTHIDALGRALDHRGISIVSTGGTASALEKFGCSVTFVENVTGFPEMMDGRLKTLHPRVHGGLLAIRDNPKHVEAMQKYGIEPIDLLVVNLYPFADTVAKGKPFDDCVENIDIGGPAMIRAAGKNHQDVVVIVDPEDYVLLFRELRENDGQTTLAFRRLMMAKAYRHTADYDTLIAEYMEKTVPKLNRP